ncbi:hypothetical protein HU200_057569 [Digitaria exilis]|uniref:UspA domain-containing protein n=1 Tax=Digitaria exilis TaxID=1010633 RepID=A0A835AJM5_9POAL|nr:hypothetical protein HU200_057569 [Digitaria exilis]
MGAPFSATAAAASNRTQQQQQQTNFLFSPSIRQQEHYTSLQQHSNLLCPHSGRPQQHMQLPSRPSTPAASRISCTLAPAPHAPAASAPCAHAAPAAPPCGSRAPCARRLAHPHTSNTSLLAGRELLARLITAAPPPPVAVAEQWHEALQWRTIAGRGAMCPLSEPRMPAWKTGGANAGTKRPPPPPPHIYPVRPVPPCQTSRICKHAMEGTGQSAASGMAGARVDDGAAGGKALKVVAAVDASEESLHALSWALDHVVRCHPDAALVVVHAQHAVDHFVYPVAAHVWDRTLMLLGFGDRKGIAYAPATAVESMRKAQEENSRRILARALDMCKERQVGATGAIVEGDPKEAICQAVERFQAGLLVLGSRGLGRIKRAFLGSVSDYLSHHACCPVLVVKPTKAQAK